MKVAQRETLGTGRAYGGASSVGTAEPSAVPNVMKRLSSRVRYA